MIRHTAKITAPLAENTSTFELSLIRKFNGKKDWQIRRNYPEAGLGLYYVNYNRPDIYGQVFGVVPHLRLRVITKKNFSWTLRGGIGLGYLTMPFERVPNLNLKNETVGGHINNLSPLQTDLRFRINDHIELQGGAHLIHVSNASFRRPNFGINIWGYQFGIRYFPESNRPEKIERELPKLSNRILVYCKASIAFVETGLPDGGLNRVYNGGVFATKRYLGKNKVHLGIDYTYNTAIYGALKYYHQRVGEENRWSSQISVFTGNEFEFNRFGILLMGGYYLRKMNEQTDKFFQKLGGTFYAYKSEEGLLNEIMFSALLKTHLNRAELFELGVSFGF